MKIITTILVFCILVSCAPRRTVVKKPLPSGRKPSLIKPTKKFRTSLLCEDTTTVTFNTCGIEVFPFARTAFYDLDKDGTQEMIIGSKDGLLRLYKHSGSGKNPRWHDSEAYFNGIKVGAFSSPAIGDIDNDGKPEILVGTGGFSSASGQVIFYRNEGTGDHPRWERINSPEIRVGNDATPALLDVDNNGRLDIIVGNSAGRLRLFMNRSNEKKIIFQEDPSFFRGVSLGKYIVPTATRDDDRIILVAGDSMGKLSILEKKKNAASWTISSLDIAMKSFAAPTFIKTGSPGIHDLVVSDGNGRLYHFMNMNNDYREWEESPDLFAGRIFSGPGSTPAITSVKGKSFLIVGNIFGNMKFFEYDLSSEGLPWVEKPDYFRKVDLTGYSKGFITEFQDKELLIAGQQNGLLTAFLNFGSIEYPLWTKQTRFFETVPKIPHAAPTVFDLNGDGRWELIVGDARGYLHGFSYSITEDGRMEWKEIENIFGYVKVNKYATPALFRDPERLYLLVGQQDGTISTFIADAKPGKFTYFYQSDYLPRIQVNNHSTPSVHLRDGIIELSIGDYHGNIKHFACKKTEIAVNGN